MTRFQNKYRIESNRRSGWDYSTAGWYFLTWVTHKRLSVFGEINGSVMVLNPLGKIVETEILKSATIRHELIMGEYVIMPNHVHLLVGIQHNMDSIPVETHGCASLQSDTYPPENGHKITKRLPRSISSFVAGLKSAITTQINQYRQTPGQPLWQRNYHDRIIRSESELYRVKQYIIDNPARWRTDCFNP